MRNLKQIGLNIWVRSVKNQVFIGLFWHFGDVIMLVHLLTYVQDLVRKHFFNFYSFPKTFLLINMVNQFTANGPDFPRYVLLMNKEVHESTILAIEFDLLA